MAILSSLPNVPTELEWAIFAVFVLAVFYACRYFISSRPHFPPGPRPDPIIGNLRHIPLEHSERVFAEWSNTYGDVVYAQLLGKQMIILNTLQAARDLMEKRSAIYSDRPRFVLLTELMGWHHTSTLLRYGPQFRKHRRFIQQTFNQRAVLAFRPLQETETGILLDGFLRAPDSFMQHIRRYAAAAVMKITYGHTVKSADDPFVHLAERAGTLTVESGTPAATLVDFFPLMKYLPAWVPGGGFQRSASEVRKAVENMMNVPFETVKKNMRSGIASPSFTSSLLEAHRKAGAEASTADDEEDIKGAAGSLNSAAEDTTSAVLSTFLLAMILYPEVYRKAQEEMRRVLEPGRLPNFDDRASLPYLECVLKEVFRWNCPVPLGLPHQLMADDVYRGYHIPGGAMVIANIWAMSQACSQPEIFRPERYMDEADLIDPLSVVFGFGRRVCPGRHFAQSSVWLAIANITATLRLAKPLDEQGREITPPVQFTSGFVSHPKPFTCSIQPLSKQSVELIHQANADVEL